jgi:hypothetical protein
MMLLRVISDGVGHDVEGGPRLSAAIMIPSLYLRARTLVPVTIGCL